MILIENTEVMVDNLVEKLRHFYPDPLAIITDIIIDFTYAINAFESKDDSFEDDTFVFYSELQMPKQIVDAVLEKSILFLGKDAMHSDVEDDINEYIYIPLDNLFMYIRSLAVKYNKKIYLLNLTSSKMIMEVLDD